MWTRTGSARAAAALLALAALALPARARAAQDDVELYDTLSSNQVALGDTVTLTVQISGSQAATQAELNLPPMPAFDVLSQHRSTSVRMSMMNGSASVIRSKVVTIALQPKHVGTLHLAAITAQVGGRTYKTGELTLQVTPPDPNRRPHRAAPQNPVDPFAQMFGGQNPFAGMPGMGGGNGGGDPFARMMGEGGPPSDSDLFLRTTVDKKQAYLGEQITYSIYLFARVDVSRVDNPKLPKLDAFWAEDIESPTNITGDVRTVNGVPYRVYLLKRRALFPLKAGKQVIDPVEVDVITGLSLFGSGHTAHRTSPALTVTVLPLPAGAPPDFSTTDVGQWRLSLATVPPSPSPVKTTVGQPVTLHLTIEGQGNLRNLAIPKMPTVRGLRFYDPTTTDKVHISHSRFGGRRTLEYIAMPQQTGHLVIPALRFPYFNPQTHDYQVAQTEPLALDVTAGAVGAAPSATPGVATASAAGQNVLGANLVRPIHTRAAIAEANRPLWTKPYFVPALLFPFGLMLGGALFTGVKERAGRDDPTKRTRTAKSRAHKRFKGALALLGQGDAAAYYGAVARSVNDYLTDKLGFSASGLTRDELARRLHVAGAKGESVHAVCAVLETCDLGRFAPGSTEGQREVLAQAEAAIEALESQKLARGEARS